jgi:hypothetical protein
VLRLVPSVMYASSSEMDSPDHTFKIWAIGTTFEYAVPLTSQIVAAGGLGFGVDLLDDSYQDQLAKNGWGTLRLSPTLRFDRLDVAVHFQFVYVTGRVVTLAELGLDYFVW